MPALSFQVCFQNRRIIVWTCGCLLAMSTDVSAAEPPHNRYERIVRNDRPVAWWRFEESKAKSITNVAHGDSDSRPAEAAALTAKVHGRVTTGATGPRPDVYPLFESNNRALDFPGGGGSLRVDDPGSNSPLDFTTGDSITLEAWVKPQPLSNGRHAYLVGKGRTGGKGFARDNQNYALRLTGKSGEAAISFLFRNAKNRTGVSEDFHRWTSSDGVIFDGRWHHVAVTYTFGKPKSLRGYIDGEPVSGKWDMGGATADGPVVDDDELWIGSSMGQNAGSTFLGGLDEVAVYRTALAPERVKLRYRALEPEPYVTNVPIPEGRVLVEIQEGVPAKNSWAFVRPEPVERYTVPAFAFMDVPHKYSNRGLRIDRSNPFVVQATGVVTVPEGRQQVLVRSRSSARLFMDGKLMVETPFHSVTGGGHQAIRDARKLKEPHLRPLQPGDSEELAVIEGDGKSHRFRLELMVGGKDRRKELSETSVSLRPLSDAPQSEEAAENVFHVLSPSRRIALTDDGWTAYFAERREALLALNAKNRRERSKEETAYWNRRHESAERHVERIDPPRIPATSDSSTVHNEIDRFINHRLDEAKQPPQSLADDWTFLRRATVDVTGTIPTPEQIESFFADESPHRRKRYIDRMLAHPGWAHNWVGYWQDVLAENPNILKPSLNNTGPFRYWILESFEDNKPFDRFVTELVMMEGGRYLGGPAGFEMASQNDAPMAAKAHIVSQAFLGVQMKCARCHDAPFHELRQRDLFSIAAMLNRAPQPVPMTSSIPLSDEALESLVVKVTLKPGSKVKPDWPFAEISNAEFDAGVLRNPDDTRERLAALITSPENQRFARVAVNRLWQRYMGRGLVEPVDDWEHADPSHPQLLDWLAREFVANGYDVKHVARLILNSHAYQRMPSFESVPESEKSLFAGPLRRRMTAEQVVDSLFSAAGKPLNAGRLTFDLDGARPYSTFLNFGVPRRAWEFTSLSNERDRPSLALPYAQDFVTLMKVFGWRASRQSPLTVRDHDPTVLQPGVMSNGVVARRITRLSDDGALTALALEEQPVETLVDRLFKRLLTRPPSTDERELFMELLGEGYSTRRLDVPDDAVKTHFRRPTGVSWSNHLRPEANRIKIEQEKLVQQGDPPSIRLEDSWRKRMEDAVWTLINTPEFVYLP